MKEKYAVSTESFSGPLELLLELIEKQKLPITEVSLAQVTDGFLSYLDNEQVPSEELADFLVVASKLLLIKSRAILPVPEEVDDTGDNLALQLRMYKEFIVVAEKVDRLFKTPNYLFARERTVSIKKPEFVPPPEISASSLSEAFANLLKRLEPFFSLRQESIKRAVSVQERLGEIREALFSRSQLKFKEIISNTKSKVEVVVSFLALLELVKQRLVKVVQDEQLKDITITHLE